MGHDGQIYKDEAASRGAEDFKGYADAAQANWKAKGTWEKEHPIDLSDAFATYDPQSGMYWVYTRSDEFTESISGDAPGYPVNLQSTVTPDAPGAPENLQSSLLHGAPGIPTNLQSSVAYDAPGVPTNLQSSLIPDAPGVPTNLQSSLIPDVQAPGIPQNLQSSLAHDAPGVPQNLTSSLIPDAPGIPTSLTSQIVIYPNFRNSTSVRLAVTDWLANPLIGSTFMTYDGLRDTGDITASSTQSFTKLATSPTGVQPSWKLVYPNGSGGNNSAYIIGNSNGSEFYIYNWYGDPTSFTGAPAGITSAILPPALLGVSRTITGSAVSFTRNFSIS
jgi:hypothetical protein